LKVTVEFGRKSEGENFSTFPVSFLSPSRRRRNFFCLTLTFSVSRTDDSSGSPKKCPTLTRRFGLPGQHCQWRVCGFRKFGVTPSVSRTAEVEIGNFSVIIFRSKIFNFFFWFRLSTAAPPPFPLPPTPLGQRSRRSLFNMASLGSAARPTPALGRREELFPRKK
jgi:hypothetical protein